jgi:hypothetical protein
LIERPESFEPRSLLAHGLEEHGLHNRKEQHSKGQKR